MKPQRKSHGRKSIVLQFDVPADYQRKLKAAITTLEKRLSLRLSAEDKSKSRRLDRSRA